ncbi:hypothetical protein [Methylovirgula sp. HY1]|uniref:hypothetical protein n=1 Tax=Methylovirgula sp. HY1 TaxID=2822761 RepID=UPI001C5BCF04|nr:hypothetical protein [Methylovirgula sp. HY1]
MKRTLDVLNQMVKDKIIESYAIGGAIAAYNYIEPTLTEDLDILVSFEHAASASGLMTLTPIVTYLASKGYTEFRKEGIVVSGWPVQFLPVANPLDAEALNEAIKIDIEISPSEGSVSAQVLTAEHIMATALAVGRPKDHIRLTQFIEMNAYDGTTFCEIIDRHELRAKWVAFCARFDIFDPYETTRKP